MNIFKFLIPISLYATMSVGNAQVFSNPVGAVKIDINPGDGTNSTLTAISANLLQPVEWSGQVTLNSDTNNPWIQGISNASNDWPTDNSWAGLNEDDRVPNTGTRRIPRFLAFITDNNGAEQAFDIWSVSAGSLNIQYYRTEGQNINIQDIGFPNETTMTVRAVNTVAGLFGTGETLKLIDNGRSGSDRIFLWDGVEYVTYTPSNGGWVSISSEGNNNTAGDDVVFPDEGMYIQRFLNVSSSITFTGDVPTLAQVSEVRGNGSFTFVANRYPVASTIDQIISDELLTDWDESRSSTDRIFRLLPEGFATYARSNGAWIVVPPNGVTLSVTDPIPPETPLFIQRSTSSIDRRNTHSIPYSL